MKQRLYTVVGQVVSGMREEEKRRSPSAIIPHPIPILYGYYQIQRLL